jgi:tetratricopeptide (TPR) repeat protein
MRRAPSGFAILAVALMAVGARAQSESPEALAERIQATVIEASDSGDDDALRQGAALAERALTLHPDDALLYHYHGYALYRLGARHACDEEQEPGCVWRLLERAKGSLEASLARGPRAETYALLGSVYGLMIGENPTLGASLGQRIDDMQSKALALDPENPRVWLLKGIGDFHTPEAYGGGGGPARAALERAAAEFQRDAPPPPEPRWGRVDVHVWLGQVLQAAGERDRARAQYEKALALEPDHAWVRDQLLPSLESEGP